MHVNNVVPLAHTCLPLLDKQWCLNKNHLHGVTWEKFSSLSSHIVAYCNMVQVMHNNKLSPQVSSGIPGGPSSHLAVEEVHGDPHWRDLPLSEKKHKVTDNYSVRHNKYNTLAHGLQGATGSASLWLLITMWCQNTIVHSASLESSQVRRVMTSLPLPLHIMVARNLKQRITTSPKIMPTAGLILSRLSSNTSLNMITMTSTNMMEVSSDYAYSIILITVWHLL